MKHGPWCSAIGARSSWALAERVGVEVPDAELPRLTEILQEQSNAHLLEALRRAKVRGWQAEPVLGDATFEQEVSKPGKVQRFPSEAYDDIPFWGRDSCPLPRYASLLILPTFCTSWRRYGGVDGAYLGFAIVNVT